MYTFWILKVTLRDRSNSGAGFTGSVHHANRLNNRSSGGGEAAAAAIVACHHSNGGPGPGPGHVPGGGNVKRMAATRTPRSENDLELISLAAPATPSARRSLLISQTDDGHAGATNNNNERRKKKKKEEADGGKRRKSKSVLRRVRTVESECNNSAKTNSGFKRVKCFIFGQRAQKHPAVRASTTSSSSSAAAAAAASARPPARMLASFRS